MTPLRADDTPPLMRVEAFLVWARQQQGVLYDLVDGVPRAHDASMTDHGVIQTNLTLLIHTHLRAAGARCRLVQTPGIRSHIASDWNHRVPEMAVTCSPNRSSTSSLIDPLLVIEILSKTNAAATWSNIPLYASLPSVQEVLVVDSRKLEALVLRRGADGHWPPNPEAADPAHGCRLASIDLTLPFAEIYAQTEVWTRSHGADPATE